MFYLIGLGQEIDSITNHGLKLCKKCKKIYLDTYTIKIHYKTEDLEKAIGKKITPLARGEIEQESFLEDAKNQDIGLLVFGSPLVATTHVSLLVKCRKENILYKVIHNASILDLISETGLQLYKFGKTASMPAWSKTYNPDSFIKIINENLSIGAHTLLLIDIGLSFNEALKQLIQATKQKKINKILVCSQMGTDNQKILYDTIENLTDKKIQEPFSLIIPGKLHFLEEEMLSLP